MGTGSKTKIFCLVFAMSTMSLPQALSFRALVESDLSQLWAIESAVYTEPWSKDLLRDSLAAPMTHAVGLSISDQICGYSIYQIVLDEGHLLNLAVDPAHQRRGLGGQILDHSIHQVRARGVKRFFLEVRPANEAANKLYESRGFRGLFLREKYYASGEHALVMFLDV